MVGESVKDSFSFIKAGVMVISLDYHRTGSHLDMVECFCGFIAKVVFFIFEGSLGNGRFGI